MFLISKYTEYKAAQQEQQRKKVTEKELSHLNHKIDKLLSKLEEHEPEMAANQDEECVVCVNAKATMTTYPCSHRVVCRKCFVKTIQMAVAQRLLPLRCVICRAKILKLKQGSPTMSSNNVPQSASLYSVASNSSNTSGVSWTSASSGNSSTSTKTDPFPTIRRAQMARLGYQPLRSSSPPPKLTKRKSHYSQPESKIQSLDKNFNPTTIISNNNNHQTKGKAKLSQEFQREFRLGILRTMSKPLPTKESSKIRCCGDLVNAAEAWKKQPALSPVGTAAPAQGRRG